MDEMTARPPATERQFRRWLFLATDENAEFQILYRQAQEYLEKPHQLYQKWEQVADRYYRLEASLTNPGAVRYDGVKVQSSHDPDGRLATLSDLYNEYYAVKREYDTACADVLRAFTGANLSDRELLIMTARWIEQPIPTNAQIAERLGIPRQDSDTRGDSRRYGIEYSYNKACGKVMWYLQKNRIIARPQSEEEKAFWRGETPPPGGYTPPQFSSDDPSTWGNIPEQFKQFN